MASTDANILTDLLQTLRAGGAFAEVRLGDGEAGSVVPRAAIRYESGRILQDETCPVIRYFRLDAEVQITTRQNDPASATDWFSIGSFMDTGIENLPEWKLGHPADLVVPADNALDPASPQRRSAQAEVYGLLRRDNANPLVPLEPYSVLIEELLIVGNPLGQEVGKLVTLILEARLEVEPNPPYPHVVRGHPCPAQHFEEVEDHLPLPECIEEDGHGP